MTRQVALLRLQNALLARREDLREHLSGELASLHHFKGADTPGDSADLAFEAGSDEISSRLAELDASELSRIERVLTRLKQGTYGICEGGSALCQHKIPMARLNALPYAMYCIHCERELEKTIWFDRQYGGNWAHVSDFHESSDDKIKGQPVAAFRPVTS